MSHQNFASWALEKTAVHTAELALGLGVRASSSNDAPIPGAAERGAAGTVPQPDADVATAALCRQASCTAAALLRKG